MTRETKYNNPEANTETVNKSVLNLDITIFSLVRGALNMQKQFNTASNLLGNINANIFVPAEQHWQSTGEPSRYSARP